MTTTSSAIQSFTCETCGTGFTSFEKLKDHTHRLHGGDREAKKRRMVMPEGRTTLFALGVAFGLVVAGSAAWYLSKRGRY